MNELSLFSGAGGGLLGSLLLGWTPIGYVEYDDYCQRVIAQRIKDGILPNAPIFGDIRTFISEGYAASYQGMVDVISGGFPCQPFSVAGKQLGADDPRNMWPATVECIRIIRPRYALLENVPGLLSSGYFGTILGDLAESGYDARWRILSAAEMGAPHRRDRLWIVAYSNGVGLYGHGRNGGISAQQEQAGGIAPLGAIEYVADSPDHRSARWSGESRPDSSAPGRGRNNGRGSHDHGGSQDVSYAQREQDDSQRRDCQLGWNTVGWSAEAAQRQDGQADSDSVSRCSGEMADADSGAGAQWGLSEREGQKFAQSGSGSQDVGDSTGAGLSNGQHEAMGRITQGAAQFQPELSTWWEAEPRIR